MQEYIERVKAWNDEYYRINGYCRIAEVRTFGCQMNVHDSETLAGMLEEMGYSIVKEAAEPDLVLLNTCCVRENAENRTLGHIGNLKLIKEQKSDMIIGVCGCMAQEPGMVEKIKKSYTAVDLVFGTHNLQELPRLLAQVIDSRHRVIDVHEHESEITEGLPVKRDEKFRAWVTIMYGCNNFCSYCIVPYVRGRERSRRPEAILEEVRQLVADGYKEVTLLGQNVNSYGKGLEGDWNFARLLRKVAATGIYCINFQTSHPKDLSDELIAVIAEHTNISRHLHLPVQSGSTRILREMNRKYTKEDYLKLVQKIKLEIPDIVLTTDIIVGFPGETEDDFLETLDLVEQVRYDGAFTFIYSPREGTPAAKLVDPIAPEAKSERMKRLLELQNKISWECNRELIGSEVTLLVEGISEKNETVWSGRTSTGKLVHFTPQHLLNEGDLVKTQIIDSKSFTLLGKIVD